MDRSLLQIFSAEQREHVERFRELLQALPAGPSAVIEELLRRAHTLKGAARAVGLVETETLLHAAEEPLAKIRDGDLPVDAEVRGTLSRVMDCAEDLLAAAIADRPAPDIAQILRKIAEMSGDSRVLSRENREDFTAGPPASSAPENAPQHAADLMRVDPEHLNQLIRSSSQLLMMTTGMVSADELERNAHHLDSVAAEWERLRRRAMAATASARASHAQVPTDQAQEECFGFVDRNLDVLRRESHAAALHHRTLSEALHRQAGDLHQDAFRVRTVAAEVVLGGFGPMVRDLGRQEGKEIEFEADGLELQADRLVLQAFKDSVMHLLRNAVSHGIEPPVERLAAGKPAVGAVRLRIVSRGDRMTIQVDDDGRGVSRKAVAEEARRRGLIGAGEAVGSEQAADFIQQPGFSTAKMITTLSGRGMGLSSVRESVSRWGGELRIRPRRPSGTSVSISVPLSISKQHVLLAGVSNHVFAISTAFVERLVRFSPLAIKTVNGRSAIAMDTETVPLSRLADLLNLAPVELDDDEGRMCEAVVLTWNDEREAILVDRLIDERDAAIKDTGLPGSMAGLTAGAIPQDDGTVAVMLNVTELFARIEEWRAAPREKIPAPRRSRPARILVVDDSLTTRALEKSILEASGYQVEIAVDGLDALERVVDSPPDLVISDVMMPRLTGFQLLEKMKNSERTRKVPVILVTSLESREEQQKGLSLGADAYIVKRRFDQKELLKVVRQIL